MDISDIGFLSPRPYELMDQGHSEKDFESRYKFKSSPDLDKLPQIISGNISVNILPYWCDRDVRTIVSLGKIDTRDFKFTGVKHSTIDDCLHQINYCKVAYNNFMGAVNEQA